MKIKFKHQKFQADAAKAVVDVFAGDVSDTFIHDGQWLCSASMALTGGDDLPVGRMLRSF